MSEVSYADTLIPEGDMDVGLSRLVGKEIREVCGYFADIGAGASFKLTHVIFDDGSQVGVEGEHDFPYVVTFRKWEQPNLDDETLERLYEEQNAVD